MYTDEERQAMIDAIESGEIDNPSDVVLYASDIDDDRDETVR